MARKKAPAPTVDEEPATTGYPDTELLYQSDDDDTELTFDDLDDAGAATGLRPALLEDVEDVDDDADDEVVLLSDDEAQDEIEANGSRPHFDYDVLSFSVAGQVEEATDDIKRLIRRSAQDIIQIGKRLADVKEILEHGQFIDWLNAEFAWSIRTAQNMMACYRVFPDLSDTADIDARALYYLASGAVSPDVREDMVARSMEGQRVTFRMVKDAMLELNIGLSESSDDAMPIPQLPLPRLEPETEEELEDIKVTASKEEKAAKMIANMGWLTELNPRDVAELFDDIQRENLPDLCDWFTRLGVAL